MVAEVKTEQLRHRALETLPQLHPMSPRHFHSASHDLRRQLRVRRKGDIFFLNRRVHDHFLFFRPFTVELDRRRQNLLRSCRADAFAKVRQLARITWEPKLQLCLPE